MKELSGFIRKMNQLERVYTRLPGTAAVIAVRFFKERFREQAWLDSTKDKWQARKRQERGKRNNRGILMDTGRLKRSIRKGPVNHERAIIYAGGTGIKYARIHNEGGRVSGSFTVKQHNRKQFERNRKGRKETVKAHKVKAHTRKVNFTMPKRQFIGASRTLDKRLQLKLTAEIMRALK